MAYKGSGGAPRSVKAVWVTGNVSTRKAPISMGGDEIDLTILVREHGRVSDKRIKVRVRVVQGQVVANVFTLGEQVQQSIMLSTEAD
jgi:hypothetical protein